MDFITNLVFAISSIAAGIIAYKCSVTPNPKPAHAEKNDVLFSQTITGIYLNGAVYLMKYTFIALGILAAYLSLIYPNILPTNTSATSTLLASDALLVKGLGRNSINSWVCPNPQNLDRSYILPTPYSITCLLTILLFGALRLLAFDQLGSNFTFHLARPSGLMTSGLYAYMQHPSYTASVGFITGIFLLWLQPKGVVGCFMPETWARSEGLLWWLWAQFVVSMGWVMVKRVVQEEGMLKREFGGEWVEYAGRTKRFVPGVF